MNDLSIVRVENHAIAQSLREVAEILQAQRANPFRVGAYRKAADSVEAYAGSVREIFVTQGAAGLDALPGVGPGIAAAIAEMLRTGRWSQLERLRGSLDPASLFQTVAGIGPELAHRIHDVLGVDTLEALEQAAYDGRLESVEGVGPRRVTAIRAALAEMLGRRLRRVATTAMPAPELPAVDVLLDVDREYRQRAARSELPTITRAPLQSRGEAVAAGAAHHARQVPLHGAVLEHGKGARARAHAGLGGAVFRRQSPRGAAVHGGDGAARRVGREARAARSRSGVPRALRIVSGVRQG